MKTWICTTMATFFAPQQGAARLYAYLRKQGHDVALKDLNQQTYFALMSRKYLEAACERLALNVDAAVRNQFLRQDLGSILLNGSVGAIKGLVANGLLHQHLPRFLESSGLARTGFRSIIKSRLKSDNIYYALLSERNSVIAGIDAAAQKLDKWFFSLPPDEFMDSFRTILCGKAIMDAAYFPAQLDFGMGFHGTEYNPRTGDILRAVEDENHNFLLPYYRDEVMPLFHKEQPDVVGISITHTSEFIPAFTLAHAIKRARPATHITLGGSVATEVAYRIIRNAALWDNFDSLVLGPGERVMSELVERLETRADLSKVPNLFYKDGHAIRKSDLTDEFDINDACTPEYVSLRPKSGLPLETASGCYWGKCIFCFYPRQGTAGLLHESSRKRVRNIELVLDDISKLKEAYNPVAIGLTDSAVPPRRLEQIAEYNLKSKTPVKFSAFMRFEKDFKSEAFCRKLSAGGFMGGQIGLESGSQRINNIINKGVNVTDAAVILQKLHAAGILLHLYTMVGLPGETEADAMMTYNFLKQWHKNLLLGWQIYPLYVLEQGAIAQRAAEFGLKATPFPEDVLVQAMRFDVAQGLSQEQSTGLAISLTEKLQRTLPPLHRLMDIESVKLVMFAQQAHAGAKTA